jgi:hypothetical protein
MQPKRRVDLIAHERQQRRDDDGGACSPVPQQAGGDEVDRALAPAGALHDQEAAALFNHGPDGFQLAVAELR